jgi:hypothetical protein
MTLRDQALLYEEPRTERTGEVSGFGPHRLLRGYAACAAPWHSYDAIAQCYLKRIAHVMDLDPPTRPCGADHIGGFFGGSPLRAGGHRFGARQVGAGIFHVFKMRLHRDSARTGEAKPEISVAPAAP